jgi:hypothetical protein
MLAEEAHKNSSRSDWIYVNIARPDRPIAIELPSGRASGCRLTGDVAWV